MEMEDKKIDTAAEQALPVQELPADIPAEVRQKLAEDLNEEATEDLKQDMREAEKEEANDEEVKANPEMLTKSRLLKLLIKKQYVKLREVTEEEQPADLAELLEELDENNRLVVFRLLKKEVATEAFAYMSDEARDDLVNAFSDVELVSAIEEMSLDDAADLLEDMPAGVVKRVLEKSSKQTRESLNKLLNYPESSAGSLMTPEYVRLRKDMTVGQAFDAIRKQGENAETVYTCYVTQNRVLLGVVTVKTLLLSPYETKIKDIMETNVISVTTHEDKEDVAQMFSKYDLSALPVVDGENRLVGIITFDDAMDVMEEEATEDFEKMAAILPGDKPYLKTGVFETWRSRIPWLLMLMLSATFSGMIITHFESALAACVVLTSFITMLSGTGGNSGSQSSVAVIRALSLGEVEFSDMLERAARGPAVRRVSGGGQLREDDAGGPDADAQPPGHRVRGPGGLSDPDVYRGLRQDRGLHPAHGGREDRHRPRRHGRPLHHYRGRRPVPAHLLRHRHRDLGALNQTQKRACVDFQGNIHTGALFWGKF